MTTGFPNGGPPPSTLAAQLVEDISVSGKSSRHDENSELKGLFVIIQRVKENPDLLKSHQERVEHNHMLVYVYSRVVLEGLKLDDPFLDKAHVRSEALKAINFLRFTIKETPSVLVYQSANHGLLFRGQEQLWVWLLPHILRLLGHPSCLELEGSIEGFLQYLFLVIPRSGVLWEFASSLVLYLRATLTSKSHLNCTATVLTCQDSWIFSRTPSSFPRQRICRSGLTFRLRLSCIKFLVMPGQKTPSASCMTFPRPLKH
jgi:serine/threonine-protein kinase ATR